MLFLNGASLRISRPLNDNLKVNVSFLLEYTSPLIPIPIFLVFGTFFVFLAQKPGDIHALTDYLLEDYKNFPKVPEFGEETARFIRQEMEDTWGSGHLSVLPEAEAQHWILGVGSPTF